MASTQQPAPVEAEVFFNPKGLSYQWIHSNHQKTQALIAGLRNVGLLSPAEKLMKYKDESEWVRGGAESYITTASLSTSLKTASIFVKTCVSMGGSSARFQELMQRREHLMKLGIRVPHQYGKDETTSYEEYIEHDLLRVKEKLHDDGKAELAKTAGLLDGAGYKPLSCLSDMRISGCFKKVYYVDFGFDLGSPDAQAFSKSHTPCLNQLNMYFPEKDLIRMTALYWKERDEKSSDVKKA